MGRVVVVTFDENEEEKLEVNYIPNFRLSA